MSPAGADVTSLAAALAGVERRLAWRARARNAALVAAGAALPAWLLVPGVVGGAAIALGAVAGAALARPLRGGAARWLDRHGADDDLMISGAAAADGRVATALSDDVIDAAGARARTARRPPWWPVLAGACAVAGLSIAVGSTAARAGSGGRQGDVAQGNRVLTSVREGDEPRGVDGARGDRGAAGAVLVGGPREAQDGATPTGAGSGSGPGSGADGAGSAAAAGSAAGSGAGTGSSSVEPTVAGSGAGAGDRGAQRSAGVAGDSGATAAAAAGSLATSAPRAGASADVAGVPVRYRELVGAYLARAERGR